MKKESFRISRKYARALFDIALQGAKVDAMQAALDTLASLWQESSDMRTLLIDPRVPAHSRDALLVDIAAHVYPGDETFSRFLLTLGRNKRLPLIPALNEVFKSIVSEFKKVLSLEMISAQTLEADEREGLQRQVEAQLPEQYRSMLDLRWNQDASLIGGLMVRAGDTLLDGSVRGSLLRMQQAFAK